MNELEAYNLKKKAKRFAFKGVLYLICFFMLTQLASCFPSFGYPIRMINRPILQAFHGIKADSEKLTLKETYTDYKDPHPNQIMHWEGYEIKKTFVKIYRATGIVVYVDPNDALLKSWFYSHLNKKVQTLYDAIAPVDLSLVFGKTAEPDNLKKLKFSHYENMLRIQPKTRDAYYNSADVTNIHVIPANSVIEKVVKNLHSGDTISVVGYLTDWSGTGELADADFKTSRFAGEMTPESPNVGLCKQLYLMEITLNGYTYK